MEPGVESHLKTLLRLLAAIIEDNRICAGHNDRTVNGIVQSACRDWCVIASDLRGIGIAQVPLQPIHSRLNGAERRFFFSNLLIATLTAAVRLGGRVFLMHAGLTFACRLFLLVFFLLFCGKVQSEAANNLPLFIDELQRCRSLAVVVLRNVKEDGRTEWRIIAGIGRTGSFRAGNAVSMSQPGLLRSE